MSQTCTHHLNEKTPTQILKDEHRVIEQVLDALEIAIDQPAIDAAFYRDALDFFRHFADGCHHAKEEEQFFPALEAAGIPREGGPIGCMLNEHQQGRALLRMIDQNLVAAAAGDETAGNAVREAARQYIVMLRMHIHKEDNVLFMIADRTLACETMRRLTAAFEHADGTCQKHKHNRYLALADDLARRASQTVASVV